MTVNMTSFDREGEGRINCFVLNGYNNDGGNVTVVGVVVVVGKNRLEQITNFGNWL